MISKEKISELLLYLGIIILIVGVFSVSYYVGSSFRGNTSDIPVGQEYLIKDIKRSNSSFIIVYYDNDKNNSERMIIPSNYNVFNFTESNYTAPIMKLDNVNGEVNYWTVSIPKK